MKFTYQYIPLFTIGLILFMSSCQKDNRNLNPLPSIKTTATQYYGGEDSSLTLATRNKVSKTDTVIVQCEMSSLNGLRQIDIQRLGNAKIEVLRDSSSVLVVDKNYYQQNASIPVIQKIDHFINPNFDKAIFRVSNVQDESNISILVRDGINVQSSVSYTFIPTNTP